MRGTNRTRAAIREGLKLLLLLVLFYAIQDQIHGVRYDIYGNHLGLAEAQSSYRRKFETAFEDYSLKLTSAKVELEKLRSEFQGDQEDFRNYLDDRSQDLKGSILSRLQSEQDSVVGALTHLEGQLENLEKLSSSASPKDLGHRKEKMIFPTAQLRGNGTVGSGVIIYSEPQPEFGNSPPTLYSTFVLTAYHVVVEILGDQLDRSIVDEVHVFQGKDTEAMDVFSAKLVLFDQRCDIALLRLNATRQFKQVAELTPLKDLTSVDIFTKAYAVGCPLGNRPLPTLGEISSKRKVVGDQVFWMLSAPTYFGNSGGGVYLADDCRLIGVSSMIYTYGKTNPTVVPHMGLFVPLDTVYRWLDSEGYSFLYERRPIPKEMFWKLVYHESTATVPQNASVHQER